MTAESLRYNHQEFETVAEAEVDSRGRVSLGRAGAEPGRRYRVERNVDGVLLLIPVVSIPEREMVVWRDSELMAEIRMGLEAAERDETEDLVENHTPSAWRIFWRYGPDEAEASLPVITVLAIGPHS